MAIELEEIVDALSMLDDETTYYYDKQEERVEVVFDFDDGSYAANEDEIDWDDDRYIPLPSSREFDDYEIMAAFAHQLAEPQQQTVATSLQGRGAFRRFRTTLDELGLTQQWYDFRTAAYRRMAIEWCKTHDVAFVDNVA